MPILRAQRLPFAIPSLLLLADAGAQSISTLPTTPVAVAPRHDGWPMYGRDPQHQTISPYPSQTMNRILWQTPVDLAPQYSGSSLLIHYGSPLVSPGGTLIVTVKTGAGGGFRLEGRNVKTGALLWTQTTGWVAPPHGWFPSMGSCVTPWNEVAIPGPGGTVLLRGKPDSATGPLRQFAFFGNANYAASPSAYDNNVFINTPITCDGAGNLYFGFMVTGSVPVALTSGIARLTPGGVGTWVGVGAMSGDAGQSHVPTNSAPALSVNEESLYAATTSNSGFGVGYLTKLASATLQPQAAVRLHDVRFPGNDAFVEDDGTASPMVGPDGDVYFGVLENPFPGNNDRGWLLHFDRTLTQTKIPGAFGWDDTPSVVPASAVPAYTGTSSYLLLCKYNNYGGIGTGTGLNRVAILDPFQSFTEPISGATTMREVISVLGPTPDPGFPGGVREWCINNAAIDVARRSAIINCEDGSCYRWDFTTNTLVEAVSLTAGIGEAYTMTIVGPGGVCFAINNATLYALGN
jgi:hypothetical protein